MSCESRSNILKEGKKIALKNKDEEMTKYLSRFNKTQKGFPLSCFLKVCSYIKKDKNESKINTKR